MLRFYISPAWDARTQTAYVFAPDNWPAMNQAQREKFLADEARNWMEEQIEYGADVFTAEDRVSRAASRMAAWESGDPDDVEGWFQ